MNLIETLAVFAIAGANICTLVIYMVDRRRSEAQFESIEQTHRVILDRLASAAKREQNSRKLIGELAVVQRHLLIREDPRVENSERIFVELQLIKGRLGEEKDDQKSKHHLRDLKRKGGK